MFFISNEKSNVALGSSYKCAICSKKIGTRYNPMKEWNVKGVLCGDCYSRQLQEFYPGDHVRVNKDLD